MSTATQLTLFTRDDLYWFNEGTHLRLYHKLGSRPWLHDGVEGVYFAVWAPNARQVHVMGDFNGWSPVSDPLAPRATSGVWETFIPGLKPGTRYKYRIVSENQGHQADKSDPYAYCFEPPPGNASRVWTLDYEWNDQAWMNRRGNRSTTHAPMSIYEVHLGSWMRPVDRPGQFYTYRELAPLLVEHVLRCGFTHVEFLPVMEHPFYGSWGYQITGYYAPTSRYGTPQDLMYLIDQLHVAGVGVIFDWVPSHFPNDEFGLGYFDGTHLYEHSDPRQGIQPDWNSFVFNYGRNEVRSFLLSNALFWLDKYHVDGLRLDAVASMLYLDYSRKPGQWIPNRFGGRENLAAIDFLRDLNRRVGESYPDAFTVAEESTDWPMVSRPNYVGGLGFNFKWDMGWMHDTLGYMAHDPIYRKYHHNELTFRMVYAFSENFILPLSHDEVVYGKRSLVGRMPGDDWQRMANLRLLLGYMFTQPGKKLLFMGSEFGQWREWQHEGQLDWGLLKSSFHEGLQRWVADLNRVYREQPALHRFDCDPAGFQWVDCCDTENSVIAFLRNGLPTDAPILVACNFTPVPRYNYRVGVPRAGFWDEVLNSDARHFGGAGFGNLGGLEAAPVPSHDLYNSLNLTLPPLGMVALRARG
jgi:1,4-alpha-glucan branching enzyme